MATAPNTPAAGTVPPEQAEMIAQARADGARQALADSTKAIAAAETAAQERIAAILSHPEADGRRKLAEHFAFKTKTSVDDVAAILAIAPKDVPQAAANPLAAAMASVPNPKVGADVADMDEAQGRAMQDKVIALHRNSGKQKA